MLDPRDIKGFVFDLDGTLIDSVEAHMTSWINSFRIIAEVELARTELKPLIGLPGRRIVKEVLGDKGLRNYSLIRYLKDRFFLDEVREGRIQPFPSTHKLLKTLKATGRRVAIATSTPTYMCVHILDFLRLSNYLDTYVCGDEVLKGKPDPEIFALALHRIGIRPKEGVVVGDTLYDVVPAQSLGAVSVLVNNRKDEWRPKFITLEDFTSYIVKVINEASV